MKSACLCVWSGLADEDYSDAPGVEVCRRSLQATVHPPPVWRQHGHVGGSEYGPNARHQWWGSDVWSDPSTPTWRKHPQTFIMTLTCFIIFIWKWWRCLVHPVICWSLMCSDAEGEPVCWHHPQTVRESRQLRDQRVARYNPDCLNHGTSPTWSLLRIINPMSCLCCCQGKVQQQLSKIWANCLESSKTSWRTHWLRPPEKVKAWNTMSTVSFSELTVPENIRTVLVKIFAFSCFLEITTYLCHYCMITAVPINNIYFWALQVSTIVSLKITSVNFVHKITAVLPWKLV